MTTGSDGYLVSLHGSDESFNFAAVGNEGPIAVDGGIKTTGIAYNDNGASYDLSGNFTGNQYLNGVPSSSYDATTDGSKNYVINDTGDVYATGGDFDFPVQIFSIGSDSSGIAFDPNSGSLWIDTSGFLTQYSTTGTALSAFPLTQSGYSAVAFDRKDGTLWTGTAFGGDTLLTQYSTSGTVMQSYFLGNGLTVSGMEFDVASAPVPEPASMLALGFGALPILARRRRLRNAR